MCAEADFSETEKGLWFVKFYAVRCDSSLLAFTPPSLTFSRSLARSLARSIYTFFDMTAVVVSSLTLLSANDKRATHTATLLDSGHCKKLAPTWSELAEKHADDEWNVVMVDCTTEKKPCSDNGVRGYPTLKAFKDGKVIDYAGGRSIDQFEKFMAKHSGNAPAEDPAAKEVKAIDGVYKLTDDNIATAMADTEHVYFVKHFAPWCGHCKAMASTWVSLAANNKNAKVRIAEIDCTTDGAACKAKGVRGYPTIILYGNGIEDVKYSGARTEEAFTSFLGENVAAAAGKEEL